ncbi:type VII secretion system-associated protein [Amycolatopsis sp. NPDC059657]|uniref:type VII secretion system-associated protein n=1 Tax=Amycolatopsis sp. NPDC059657 TaxID=3346899 RepID=UPI00366CCC3E
MSETKLAEEAAMADTATTEEETEVRFEGDQWVFLIDPAWQAEQAEKPENSDNAEQTDSEEAPERPPLEAVVGGWFVEQDGETSKFHANPAYEPSKPDSPTDPVDATLQLVVRGEAEPDQLLSTMVEGTFGVAVDDDNTPVVVLSPDEVPSVLVATAPAHSRRISEVEALEGVAAWAEVTLGQLVGLLPEEGVDVLLNPGAPSSMRLIAAVLKEAVADAETEAGGQVKTETEVNAEAPAPPKTEAQPATESQPAKRAKAATKTTPAS